MDEYNQADSVFYDHYSTGLEGDVQFYVEEAQRAGDPVLELGCGTGRILIPIAQSGIQIIGLDRAPAMLALARRKVANLNTETQHRIHLDAGDMRKFSLPQRFSLITVPYRAFLHLLTPKDQRQALECMHSHLTPNGRLIFNIFDPHLETITAHLGPLGAVFKKDTEFLHPDTGHRIIAWEARQYDLEHQILEQSIVFEELDSAGRMLSRTHTSLALRYVFRYEMRHLLELSGFKVEAFYGDFQRGPFRYGGEQIWVARKA